LKIQYAPNLEIDWTDKEIEKIWEIKNRPNRARPQNHDIPLKGAAVDKVKGLCTPEKMKEIERKRYKEKAIYFLSEAGLSVGKIMDLFDIDKKTVNNAIRRGLHGYI